MAKKWFVLRVQSNKEDKVKGDLEKRIKIQGIEDFVPQILVPSEKVSEIKGGKKRVVKEDISGLCNDGNRGWWKRGNPGRSLVYGS